MKKYKKHYWVSLRDDRWYDHRLRWWVDYDNRKGICSSSMYVRNIKNLNKVLRRLEQEKYKGIVNIVRFLNWCDNRKRIGHLIEEYEIDYI